jgi:hypothetical protein
MAGQDGAGQLSPYFPPRHTTSVLEGPLHVDSDVPTFISRNQPVESLTVSPYENFLLSEAVIEAEMQVQGAKDKVEREEDQEVGAVSHLGPAHNTNTQTKRKRSSRKIDAVDTETLTQERLSEETNKVIADISTLSYTTYKTIWQELAEKHKGDWGYNDESICRYLISYETLNMRCLLADLL